MSGGSELESLLIPYSTSCFRTDQQNVNHMLLYNHNLRTYQGIEPQ